MADTLSQRDRSVLMSRIRARDTEPERLVRSRLHKMGFRFRLHRNDLPGTPDIVLPKYATAIFVHGCFWHRHVRCKKATMPKTRTAFWASKFQANVARDRIVRRRLVSLGWSVITIWECETGDPARLLNTLQDKLLPRRVGGLQHE
jgi:DNA mismatch endonuclease, patch repair protein